MLWLIKQLLFRKLKQNVTRDFFKKYFDVEKDEKVFPMNIAVDKFFFLHLRISIYDK